jgi:tripartite-type tricarboxylate transporter receptor subunit TctC
MTLRNAAISRRAALRLLAASIALPALARAQPIAAGKPITLVVSYPAGGGADLIARLIAVPMGRVLGQNVVVDNRPGGSGQIAASMVARATPDGSTLLVDASSFAVNPSLFPKLPYDSDADFVPLGIGTTSRATRCCRRSRRWRHGMAWGISCWCSRASMAPTTTCCCVHCRPVLAGTGASSCWTRR